jgi:DNA-3-methyladenine glycosylase
MYQSGGHIYVYLIYGIHEMFNVVTGQEGCGEAVLVRAAESINSRSINLSGPGRFTKSLKIDRRLNGKRLDSKEIYFLDAPKPTKIKNTKRIGVEYAGKWANRKLRFYDANSKKVSTLKQRS